MTVRIIGTGSCLPAQVVTNDDLAQFVDTSDEWIKSRTGIRERRVAKEETTAGMCIEAAKKAMEEAGVSAEEIDLIIVGTITGDYVTPSTACQIQAGIHAVNATAFDISAACSGFLFALNTAHAFIQTGKYRTALILGAETLSRIVDWKDRSTCVLFGDGAGAAVVRAEETGLIAYDQGSDGARGMCLACPGRENNNILVEGKKELGYVSMDGQEVYKFAVSTVPASIQKVLDEAGCSADDIKYFVLHQANLRILQSVSKRLHVPMERFPVAIDHYANISAGTVPILLDEMNRKGMLERGDKIILSGFGAGLTWGTALLEW